VAKGQEILLPRSRYALVIKLAGSKGCHRPAFTHIFFPSHHHATLIGRRATHNQRANEPSLHLLGNMMKLGNLSFIALRFALLRSIGQSASRERMKC
jgi:hypothetical protein